MEAEEEREGEEEGGMGEDGTGDFDCFLPNREEKNLPPAFADEEGVEEEEEEEAQADEDDDAEGKRKGEEGAEEGRERAGGG